MRVLGRTPWLTAVVVIGIALRAQALPNPDAGNTGCDNTNCSGCCDASGSCQSGNSDSSCGTDGGLCLPCQGSSNCRNGVCVGVAPVCTAAMCAAGCCDPTLGCVMPPDVAHCGAGGATCIPCGGGAICIAGSCTQPCSLSGCPAGCCDPISGVCQPGSSNAACGPTGSSCAQCGLQSFCSGGTCVQNQCASCDGCCDQGATCVDAGVIGDTRCGLSGVSCVACPPGQHCQIVSASVAQCSPIDAGPTPDGGESGTPDSGSIASGLKIANLGCNCSAADGFAFAALAALVLATRRRYAR